MQQTAHQLSPTAYKKILFHCLRYPSSKVYGALTCMKKQPLLITNAYPLFHSAINGMGLGIGLDLVQSNLDEKEGEEICGFYQYMEQKQKTAVFTRILQSNPQLKSHYLMKITCKSNEFHITEQHPSTSSSSSLRPKCPSFSSLEQDLLQAKYRLIIDMDAHLECIQLDFRNKWVS